MPRLQGGRWIFVIFLICPAYVWAAAAEMLTISTTVVGPTATLCDVGTPTVPAEHGAFIQILDQPVWFTIHSATATPSATMGGLALANTIITVDRASDFRAVRQGASNARAYIVCVPK